MFSPGPADVLDAQERLGGVAVRTPILRSDEIDRAIGARVFVKAESLQRTGAFKFRGAYNCLSRLDPKQWPGGVVAYSTGNHGLAVATVARMCGLKATIVVPSDAPVVKLHGAVRQGAELLTYNRHTESREEISAAYAARTGAAVVAPGDHPHVLAGQGTVVNEALQQLSGETNVDVVVVPCGGGGLAAGTCLAVEAQGSAASVWAGEPADFDDTKRSLAAGARVRNPAVSGSICDSLLAVTPAELPWSINSKRLERVITADDARVREAMRLLFRELRLVAEPGAAIGIAGLLEPDVDLVGRTVLVVVSGGNVDPAVYAAALVE
jgi:threonine dehydratase